MVVPDYAWFVIIYGTLTLPFSVSSMLFFVSNMLVSNSPMLNLSVVMAPMLILEAPMQVEGGFSWRPQANGSVEDSSPITPKSRRSISETFSLLLMFPVEYSPLSWAS